MASQSKYELLEEKYQLKLADVTNFCHKRAQDVKQAVQNKDVIALQRMLAEHRKMQAEFEDLKASLGSQINNVKKLKLYTQY